MRRTTSTLLTGLLVSVIAGGLLGAPTQADLTVPGTHGQQTVVLLDFGVYADYTTRVYTVEAGDTLSSLAEAKLGKASRWKEIAALNPDVKPAELGVGTKLLLPPAKQPLPAPKSDTQSKPEVAEAKAGRKHWWHIISAPQPNWELLWCKHGEAVPVHHYGTTVLAVRNDKLAEFQRMLADPKKANYTVIKGLLKMPPAWLAAAADVHPGRGSTKDSDPVHRIEQRMRITSIADGKIHTKLLSTRYFDNRGRELTSKEVQGAQGRRNLILLLLAGAGLLGLGFVVARRRRAASPATA